MPGRGSAKRVLEAGSFCDDRLLWTHLNEEGGAPAPTLDTDINQPETLLTSQMYHSATLLKVPPVQPLHTRVKKIA